jgi:hypothetical protein
MIFRAFAETAGMAASHQIEQQAQRCLMRNWTGPYPLAAESGLVRRLRAEGASRISSLMRARSSSRIKQIMVSEYAGAPDQYTEVSSGRTPGGKSIATYAGDHPRLNGLQILAPIVGMGRHVSTQVVRPSETADVRYKSDAIWAHSRREVKVIEFLDRLRRSLPVMLIHCHRSQ